MAGAMVGYDPAAEALLTKIARGEIADDITEVDDEIQRLSDAMDLDAFKVCRVALRMLRHEIGEELTRAIHPSYHIYLRLLKRYYALAA